MSDSMEGSSNVHVPLETVSAATERGSTSCADNLESAGSPDVDIITELQQNNLLELKLGDCEEELNKVKNENELLLGRQFSLDKIKDDDSAILFYTGFPSYQALISFYKFIEPKLGKMQYWKGQQFMKDSQPYQEDEKDWTLQEINIS